MLSLQGTATSLANAKTKINDGWGDEAVVILCVLLEKNAESVDFGFHLMIAPQNTYNFGWMLSAIPD